MYYYYHVDNCNYNSPNYALIAVNTYFSTIFCTLYGRERSMATHEETPIYEQAETVQYNDYMKYFRYTFTAFMTFITIGVIMTSSTFGQIRISSDQVFERVRAHDFEINSGYKGVGNLNDEAWKVRTLAIRDLVRLGPGAASELIGGLHDENSHVRHVTVSAISILGIQSAADDLMKLLTDDPDPVIRGQAAQALGQIGSTKAVKTLEEVSEKDESMHVKHRAALAIGRIKEGAVSGPDEIAAWVSLDENKFRLAKVGQVAPDFKIKDTSGKSWRISDFKNKKTVALIWIFADWCPVCHREFHELLEMKQKFKDADIQVFTVECHDLYRSSVMGESNEITSTFLKEWGPKSLSEIGESLMSREKLWWPHLVDTAGAVAAMYGVDPMEFIVHDEWINRPSTVIITPDGKISFAYYGTYWGDRPTIEETFEMIENNSYEFRHPERRE